TSRVDSIHKCGSQVGTPPGSQGRGRSEKTAGPSQEGEKMSSRTRAGNRRDVYLDLILRFPLRPIRSDEELEEAVQVIDSLVDREKLLQDEKDYLDVLSDLVERYESGAHPIDPVSDDVLLRHLMEAKRVTQ